DGAMNFDPQTHEDAYYEPNSFGGPAQDPSFAEPPLPLEGAAAHYDHRVGNDDYTQPGNLFRLLGASQQRRLFRNIAQAMEGVPADIVERECAPCDLCDPGHGAGGGEAVKASKNDTAP